MRLFGVCGFGTDDEAGAESHNDPKMCTALSLSRSLVPSFVVSLSQSVFAARRGELLRLLRVTDDSRARSASFGLDDSVAEKLINQYTHAI